MAPYSSSDAAAVNATKDFLEWANVHYPYTAIYETFEYFSEESAFLSLIGDKSYSVSSNITYSMAIIFDSGYPSWKYSLRFNQSYYSQGEQYSTPLTADSELDLTLKVNYQSNGRNRYEDPYNRVYESIGAFRLTEMIGSFAATTTCRNTNGKCDSDEDVTIRNVGVVDFPNPKTTVDGFWQSTGFLFALLIIIAVLYPLANVISTLVKEKEAKLREGMLMMALREDAYWISWAINFFALFIVLSIILTFVSSFLFANSDGFYIFAYFFVFFMGSVSYCFFISTLFNKSRTAVIFGVLLFFGGYFVYVGLNSSQTSTTRSSLIAAMLHPATAFTYGTLAFTEWEDTNIGITADTWNSSNLYPITFQDVLNMVIIEPPLSDH